MALKRTPESEILAQIPAAVRRAARQKAHAPMASSVRYIRSRRMLHVGLTNGAALVIPIALIPALGKASDAVLGAVAVGPAGLALHWPVLDVDVSVAALAQTVFGTSTLMRVAGRAGGQRTSPSKARAARANGKKGGRPRVRT